MIWTIRDLKKKARKLLKNCYWPAVAVCLLTTMLTGWIGSAGIGIGRIQAENASGLEMSEQRMRELKDDLKDRNPIAEYKISIVQKAESAGLCLCGHSIDRDRGAWSAGHLLYR